jgi:hypothetical protein
MLRSEFFPTIVRIHKWNFHFEPDSGSHRRQGFANANFEVYVPRNAVLAWHCSLSLDLGAGARNF